MLWVWLNLLMVLVSAAMAEANRRLQLDSISLNFWRTFGSLIVFLPFLFMYDWPSSPYFYVASIVTGIISAIAVIAIFHLSAKHNGRVASLSTPITAMAVFIVWFAFDESYRESFFSNTLSAVLITVCLSIACISMCFMRKCETSKDVLRIIIFISILMTIMTIFNVLVLELEDAFGELMIFSFFVMLMQVIFSASLMLYKKRSFSPTKPMLKGALILTCLTTLWCPLGWYAVLIAPNPAYAKCILMTVPVFMLAYHKALNIRDEASPIAGTIMTVAIICLILLT